MAYPISPLWGIASRSGRSAPKHHPPLELTEVRCAPSTQNTMSTSWFPSDDPPFSSVFMPMWKLLLLAMIIVLFTIVAAAASNQTGGINPPTHPAVKTR